MLVFIPLIFLIFIIIFFGSLLGYLVFDGKLRVLNALSEPETARGLIVFVFSLGTVTIAILMIAILFSNDDDDKVILRFDKSKEIFTAIIGIVGTIVGFYFGSIGANLSDHDNDVILLEVAKLGIDVDGLDLTESQFSKIDSIIHSNLSDSDKIIQIIDESSQSGEKTDSKPDLSKDDDKEIEISPNVP